MLIVKIQVSITTTADERQMLVYNKDKSIHFQCPVTEDVLLILAGRPKMYCFYSIVSDEIQISGEAPLQDW
jgi:hypothetical protein